MLNVVLKIIAQLFIARFLRNRMHTTASPTTQNHLIAVKDSVIALLEKHAVLFKTQFNNDVKRVFNSLLGLMFILLAAICSGLTGLMWLFATAWDSPNRDLILGTTMILPIILGVAVYFVIRSSWREKPLLQQTMVEIEQDWQVFKHGLDGTADISDEANR